MTPPAHYEPCVRRAEHKCRNAIVEIPHKSGCGKNKQARYNLPNDPQSPHTLRIALDLILIALKSSCLTRRGGGEGIYSPADLQAQAGDHKRQRDQRCANQIACGLDVASRVKMPTAIASAPIAATATANLIAFRSCTAFSPG